MKVGMKIISKKKGIVNTLYIPHKILDYAQCNIPSQWNKPYLYKDDIPLVIQEGKTRYHPHEAVEGKKPERYIKIQGNSFWLVKFLRQNISCSNGIENNPVTARELEESVAQHLQRQEKNRLKTKIKKIASQL